MHVTVWNIVPDCAVFLSRTWISVKVAFLLSSLKVQRVFLSHPLNMLIFCIWKWYLPHSWLYLFAAFFVTLYISGYHYVIDALTMKWSLCHCCRAKQLQKQLLLVVIYSVVVSTFFPVHQTSQWQSSDLYAYLHVFWKWNSFSIL